MSTGDIFSGGDAQILDRGYRAYEGPRTGLAGAIGSVILHSVQRGLGMRRTVWAKLLPIGAVGISYIPAIVFVGVTALSSNVQDTTDLRLNIAPSYGSYYGYVIAAILIVASLMAPEVLCTDRRSGMLGVYLASPLDRDTYLLAKAGAVAFLASLVCLGPPMLVLIGNMLQNVGPEGIGEVLLTTARVVGAGVVVTLLFTGITLGVATCTDRKAVASAGIILLLLVASSIVNGLVEGAGMTRALVGLSPMDLTMEVASRTHGEWNERMYGVASVTVWGSWALWTFGGFALARWNLQRLPVTR